VLQLMALLLTRPDNLVEAQGAAAPDPGFRAAPAGSIGTRFLPAPRVPAPPRQLGAATWHLTAVGI